MLVRDSVTYAVSDSVVCRLLFFKGGGGQTFFRAFINSELGPPEVAPCMARTFGGVSGHRRQTGSENSKTDGTRDTRITCLAQSSFLLVSCRGRLSVHFVLSLL